MEQTLFEIWKLGFNVFFSRVVKFVSEWKKSISLNQFIDSSNVILNPQNKQKLNKLPTAINRISRFEAIQSTAGSAGDIGWNEISFFL